MTLRWLVLALLAVAWPAWAEQMVVDWEYDYVNVRSSPQRSGEPVGRLSAGATAELVQSEGEWARIRFTGGEGWVVLRSLRRLPAAPEPVPLPPPTPPAVVAPSAAPAPTPTPAPEVAAPATPPPQVSPYPPEPEASDPPVAPAPEGGYLAEYSDRPEVPVFETGPSVVSVLSGLLIVLALIAGSVFLLRRLWLNRYSGGRRPGGIQILAARPVGPRQSLLLVEVGGLVWLVSQGPEGLQRIAAIKDARALERLNDRYQFLETPFESELKRSLELESAPGTGAGDEDEVSAPTPEQRLATLRRRGKSRTRT